MAISKPVSGNPVRNDGGTVVKGGDLDNSVITRSFTLAEMNLGEDSYGSKVTEKVAVSDGQSDPSGRGKAVSSGTFAYAPATNGENFLLRTAGPNAEAVNGVPSTVLAVGGQANEYTWDGIHELNTTRQLGSMADRAYDVLARPSVDVVPGRTVGTGAGLEVAFGDDDAAGPQYPSRAVPGELTYMFGGKVAKSDVYKAKDQAE